MHDGTIIALEGKAKWANNKWYSLYKCAKLDPYEWMMLCTSCSKKD